MRKSLLFLATIGACIYGFIDYSTTPVANNLVVKVEGREESPKVLKKESTALNSKEKKILNEIPTSTSKKEIKISRECFDDIHSLARGTKEEFNQIIMEKDNPLKKCEDEVISKVGVEGKIYRNIFPKN